MQGHSHFGTVSLKFDKDFDLVKLNRALGQLLTENGADIFRCKGIVAIQNDPRKFVFQGALFDPKHEPECCYLCVLLHLQLGCVKDI